MFSALHELVAFDVVELIAVDVLPVFVELLTLVELEELTELVTLVELPASTAPVDTMLSAEPHAHSPRAITDTRYLIVESFGCNCLAPAPSVPDGRAFGIKGAVMPDNLAFFSAR